MARTKDTYVQLRMTHSEKEKLSQQAAAARMNMSQYILALSEQKRIIVADGIPEVCRQLIAIGTNVNQIAKVANATKTVSERQLDLVNENLIRIQDMLGKLIDTINDSTDRIEV